jgi:D-glycero-D-manno-heptose 1,7-bisphosphate phosphatase
MRYKLIIFDADNTLRRCTVRGQPCPNGPGEWELMPNVKETLAKIDWGTPHGGSIAYGIASNQAGVALGYMTEEVAYNLLKDMVVEAFGGWPATGTIQVCPHLPDAGCKCRKPKPFMLQRLMRSWLLTPDETLYVGDMESDKQAAENAGCDFMWAWEFFG